jgi:hypothetical protein
MNILQLRQVIASLLSQYIGSYVLPGGITKPALYVAGKNRVPAEWKATGLEVVIEQYPRINPRAAVGMVLQRKEWTITMTNYDTASEDLVDAARQLSRRFPDARMSFMPESDVVYGQYRVIIRDTELDTVM